MSAQAAPLGATQADGTPGDVVPTESAPTAVATEISATLEPTEVPPTEAVATEVPTETVPTATVDDPSVGVAAIQQFALQTTVCTDPDRAGSYEFYLTGELAAAGNAFDCHTTSNFAEGPVGIRLVDAGDPSISYTASGQGGFFGFGSEVPAGTYSVVLFDLDQPSTPLYTTDAFTLSDDSYTQAAIVYYQDGSAPVTPSTEGTATVLVNLLICLNPERDGEIDLLFFDSQFQAQEAGSGCEQQQGSASALTLSNGTFTETLDFQQGPAFFYNVPYGSGYTLTNVATGAESDPFSIGGAQEEEVGISAIVYASAIPAPLSSVSVEKLVCAVPEGDARVNTTDFLTVSDVQGAETCEAQFRTFGDDLGVTLTSLDEAYSRSLTIGYTESPELFVGVPAGSYTLTEVLSDGIPYEAASDPITVIEGENLSIRIINYVAVDLETPEFGGQIDLYGQIYRCTSPDRVDVVDFVITEIRSAATADCVESSASSVTLISYGSGAEPSDEPMSETSILTGNDGSFERYSLEAGWYEITYQVNGFSEVASSGIRAYSGSSYVDIYAYVSDSAAATLAVIKNLCEGDEVHTDFFVTGASSVQGAAQAECLVAVPGTLDIEFILTDTATDQSFTVPGAGLGWQTSGVPAGEYTLTEIVTEGETVVYTATSDPFTVDPAVRNQYLIFVNNYGPETIPDAPDGEAAIFQLVVSDCIDPNRGGEFDFFVGSLQEFPTLERVRAAATQECTLHTDDDLHFSLTTDAEMSAQADFALIQTGTGTYVPTGGPIPSGTYTLSETTTGFVSEPFELQPGPFTIAELYIYADLPVPTATPTLEPGVTPTATVEPGVTPTAESTNIVANPPGDGSGDPGDPDGDDGADGGDSGGDGTDDGGSSGTDTGSGGDVTSLPSTGQGQGTSNSLLLVVLLLAGLTLLGGAAIKAGTRRQ